MLKKISLLILTVALVASTSLVAVQAQARSCDGNSAPSAGLTPTDPHIYLGDSVDFSSSPSSDSDGDPLTFLWAANQVGIEHEGETFVFTPEALGNYIVTLTAGDECDSDTVWTTVYVRMESISPEAAELEEKIFSLIYHAKWLRERHERGEEVTEAERVYVKHKMREYRHAWQELGEPYTTDSDHDRLPNYWELKFGTDSFNPDTDGDGHTDTEELLRGTDPLLP